MNSTYTLLSTDPGHNYVYNSRYPIYHSLFRNSPLVWKVGEDIPFDVVWNQIQSWVKPVWCQYKEVTENYEWKRVNALFSNYIFWNNKVWVYYLDECFYLLDKRTINETDLKGYVKPKTVWLNIETNKTFDIGPVDEELVVEATFEGIGIEEDRLSKWYSFAYHVVRQRAALRSSYYIMGKRIKSTTIGDDAGNKDDLDNLNSPDPVLDLNLTGGRTVEPWELVNPSSLEVMSKVFYQMYDRELSELGRVVNLNPRGERVSQGEYYKDIVGIADRQNLILDARNYMAIQLYLNFGVVLEFEVNKPPMGEGEENQLNEENEGEGQLGLGQQIRI